MSIRHASEEDVNNGVTPIADVPDAPTIGAVTDPGTDGYASVAFTTATTGGAVTTYTATSTPGSLTGTSATSPVTVTGLTLSTSYTFKVKGTNSTATGPESSASSAFTPLVHGAYDSIATVSGTGSSGTISFTSIPATYTHLQIRCLQRNTTNISGDDPKIRFNSDSGSNYNRHLLYGSGSAAAAAASAGDTKITYAYNSADASYGASIYGVSVIDILDYANTSKYKIVRSLSGADNNGSGYVSLQSGSWMNAAAITQIDVMTFSGNWETNSRFALYGIRGN